MKSKRKHSRLVYTYYRNFVLLIAVPIFLVLVGALTILRVLMFETATEKIELAQKNITNMLTSDIDSATLKLSQLLNANDRAAMELAAKIVSSKGQEKQAAVQQLKHLYNFAVAPSSDIIALHFYGKNDEIQYIKDALTVPLEKLRQEQFYQKALKNPDQTIVSSIPSSITYKDKATAKTRMALVVAFAPKKTETSGKIEMACLYINTHVNVAIQEYSKENAQGNMSLVDSSGSLLIPPVVGDSEYKLPQQLYSAQNGIYKIKNNGKTLHYIVSEVEGTSWKVISEVDSAELLREFNKVAMMILFISIFIFLMFIGFSVIFLRNIISPVNELISGMAQVETGDLDVRLSPKGSNEMRTLIHSFNSMVRKTKELMICNDLQQYEKHKAEIEALQSQINPHFLVNTLGSIRFIAMAAKFDSVKNMAEALIKILSGSFRHAAKLYTLEEEIEMLQSYVYLMDIRYSGNFDVNYQIAQNCNSYLIPRLILQPIVENSIVHGFETKEEPGHITVCAEAENGCLKITIEDDGCGMSNEKIQAILSNAPKSDDKLNIGVSNVLRRIRLNFGNEYGLDIKSELNKGTVTVISLPSIEKED